MKFATLGIDEACGGLLAHAIRLPDLFIPKGRRLGPEEIARLRQAGIDAVKVALIEPKDVPEDAAAAPSRIAAIVLAAGRSQRMGTNKLTMTLEGKPVVRHAVDAARAAGIEKIIVVVGHEAERVRAALAGCDVEFALNEDYAQGLSTSLKKGVAALPQEFDGALIFLGDMPDIDPAIVARIIAAFDPSKGRAIVAPRCHGRQGNPVLWARAFFPLIQEQTKGDAGAKHLIGRYAEWVAEIDAGDDMLTDLDTAEAMADRRRRGRQPDGDRRSI